MNTNAEFMDMEEAIFKFAQELYFKNQVASDLVEKIFCIWIEVE